LLNINITHRMEVSNPDSQPTEHAPADTINKEQIAAAPLALPDNEEEKSEKSLGLKEEETGKSEVKPTVQESQGGTDPV
jgi:hypothetical protein